jgi:2',3'-cyclic-nucleotide 2'-phosphodiesterase (5'-nucleotidase family)
VLIARYTNFFVESADKVFGGHDHHYEDIVINNVRVLNSGTDFRSFTILDVVDRDVNTGIIQTTTQKIDVCQTTETPDAEVVASIQRYSEIFNLGMDKVVGVTNVPLDARFSEIRTKESNVGNFICELMTRATGADIALINAGTFRADRFLGQDDGVLTEKDLCALLPIADDCMVVELTAERLLLALENGVSRYPAKEGRFLQCDGVRFAFDPNQPAGSRVVPDSVYVRNRPRFTRRRSLTRAESMEMPAMKDEVEHLDINNELQQPQDKLEDCDLPPGFSPLDYSRTYSVFSTGYVIAGKVSILLIAFQFLIITY